MTSTYPTVHLGEGETVEALAARVRQAYLEFLELPPGKPALARWLTSSYRSCSYRPPRPGAGHAEHAPAPASEHPAPDELHEDRVDTVITVTRAAVLAAIEAVAMPRPSFDHFPAVTALAPVDDRFGRRGWIPIDRPHLKLRDRVLALVAADVMMAPEDFRGGGVHVCHLCEAVYFGHSLCPRHAVQPAPSKGASLRVT